MKEGFWKIVGRYVWRIASQIVNVFVVVSVFAIIGQSTTRLIVAILGIIYVTIRAVAIGQMQYLQNNVLNIVEYLDIVRSTSDPGHLRTDFATVRQTVAREHGLTYVSVIGQGIVSLICLWEIWVALNASPPP